ncbi:hypothetical protein Bca52824_011535 [Brassica carinata]|uniref:Uncharacterized protein n=1 Tax=Brassica carinata TaxID=52824 RepID=A0A8X8BBR6_BRACI|nr:hypothetical protein Bca52824_011535 [Brassica carinata]
MPKKNPVNLSGDDTAAPIDIWWWLPHKGTTTYFLCISLFALLVRSAVSMFPAPPNSTQFEISKLRDNGWR